MRPIIALAALSLLAACSSGGEDGPTQRQQIGQVWKYEGGAAGQAKVAYIGSANSVQTPTAPDLSLIHISEPTRLLSISYAVFCLKKKKN